MVRPGGGGGGFRATGNPPWVRPCVLLLPSLSVLFVSLLLLSLLLPEESISLSKPLYLLSLRSSSSICEYVSYLFFITQSQMSNAIQKQVKHFWRLWTVKHQQQ